VAFELKTIAIERCASKVYLINVSAVIVIETDAERVHRTMGVARVSGSHDDRTRTRLSERPCGRDLRDSRVVFSADVRECLEERLKHGPIPPVIQHPQILPQGAVFERFLGSVDSEVAVR